MQTVLGGLVETAPVAVEDVLLGSSSPVVLLGLVFVYSVLVAAFLPFPAEAVLAVALVLPFSWVGSFALVILIAAAGKAVGSLVALHIGHGVSHSGPVVRLLGRVPYYEQFKRQTLTEFVRRYQYVGLGMALAVPFLPDTAPIYAFSVLENDPVRFAAAAFLGTILRLCIILAIAGGVVAVGT
jgi:membrane protein YqaA with SNARE-associated domain